MEVKLLVGVSVDGKVTIGQGRSSKEFAKLLTEKMGQPIRELREWADIIIVSRKTIEYDNSSLKSTSNSKLIRAVIDRNLIIPAERQFFDGSVESIVFTTIQDENEIARYRRERQCVVINIQRENFFNGLTDYLKTKGFDRVMFEGGGNFNDLLLKSKIVNELVVAYFPFIIGGYTTPTLVDGNGISNIDEALRLKLIQSRIVDENLVVNNYQITYRNDRA